jgi:hypothetical protein
MRFHQNVEQLDCAYPAIVEEATSTLPVRISINNRRPKMRESSESWQLGYYHNLESCHLY